MDTPGGGDEEAASGAADAEGDVDAPMEEEAGAGSTRAHAADSGEARAEADDDQAGAGSTRAEPVSTAEADAGEEFPEAE